jgi:hypothetical protein
METLMHVKKEAYLWVLNSKDDMELNIDEGHYCKESSKKDKVRKLRPMYK